MSYSYFCGSLVNDKFSKLKSDVFIINRFIYSNKYGKQVFLINYNWIFFTIQRGWGLEFSLFSKKWESLHFLRKGERLVK